jgi:acetyltransferase-like isoleucine patch superfamily enzyme
MIRKFLVWLLSKYHLHRVIEKNIIADRIQNCNANVNGKGVTFFEEARVFNYANNRTLIEIGNETYIRSELLIFPYGGKICIGNYCYIGEGTRVWSGDGITIGNNVLISHNVNIMDFAHERSHIERAEGFRSLIKKGHPLEKGNIPTDKIVIEDDVAIYAGAHIVMGVTIGKGSVISAGAVVSSNVPPFSVVAGNPGKVVWKIKSE